VDDAVRACDIWHDDTRISVSGALDDKHTALAPSGNLWSAKCAELLSPNQFARVVVERPPFRPDTRRNVRT
jgi:hypothetical protein